MSSVFNLVSRLACNLDALNDSILDVIDALLSVAYAAFSVDPSLLCPFSNATNITSICETLEGFLDHRRYSLTLRVAVVLSRLCLHSASSLPNATIAVTLSRLSDLPIEYFIDERLSDETLASLLAIAHSSGNFAILFKALHPKYFKKMLSMAEDPVNLYRAAVISRIFPSCLWSRFEKEIE